MKFRKALGVFLTLIMLMGLLPVGQVVYAEELPPLQNVSISSEGVLSWDPFEGAGGYRVIYATRQWHVVETSVDLNELGDRFGLDNGLKYVTVVALDQVVSPNNEISETWSGTFEYNGCLGTLDSPTVWWDDYVAKWSSVDHAEKYDFKLYDESDSVISQNDDVTVFEIDLSDFFGLVKGKQYYFTVVANGTKYQNSTPGISTSIEGWLETGVITGVSFDGDYMGWNPYEGADGYRVIIGGRTWSVSDNWIPIRVLCGQFGLSYGTQTVTLVALDQIISPSNQISEVWTGTYDYEPADLSGTVRIQGGAKHFGDVLELEYSGTVADIPVTHIGGSNRHYEWQISDNKTSWTNIIGAIDATLDTSILEDDAMIYVRVRVTADGYEGAVYSDIRAVNPASVVHTLEGSVDIVQGSIYETHFVIGSTITATAKNMAGNEMTMDGLMYRWQRRPDESSEWEYIDGATGKTYSPTNDDERYFLRVEVTYTQALGELYSESKQVGWRKTYHTVSFDLQGHGGEAIPDKSVQRGNTVMEPYPKPSNEGWFFDGWYTEAACTNAYDFDTPVTGNITLYAKWTKVESTDALYIVTAGSLNVRSSAGSNYDRIGGLTYGDVVQAKAISGDWVKIEYDGKDGWIDSNYLALTYSEDTAITPTEYTVTANALNVRKDISTSSDRIGGLKSGDIILATGKRTDSEGNVWFVLDYVGEDGVHQLGYVLAEFTDGKEVKEDLAVATLEFPDFPEIPEEIEPYSAMPVIASGDKIIITEEYVSVGKDDNYSVTVFPDDGDNFSTITKDSVVLPADSELIVKSVVSNEDGSITITIGKEEEKYTITYKNEDGTVLQSSQVAKGETPSYTGETPTKASDGSYTYTFKGWEPEITAVSGDATYTATYTAEEIVVPEPVTYTVTSGGNSTWTKGSSDSVTITVKRSEDDANCIGYYSETLIDGKTVTVTAKSGSTVITISSDVLEKLGEGIHTVTVKFQDGQAETALTIKAKTSPDTSGDNGNSGYNVPNTGVNNVPNTGDNSHLGLYAGLLILSLLGAVGLIFYRRKFSE